MIYKPSACKPFQDTTDINSLPFFLECGIDNSNIQVKGYSIKIYNSDNQLIFPHGADSSIQSLSMDWISVIPGKNGLTAYTSQSRMFKDKDLFEYVNLNKGYNGSDFVLPFIVDAMAPEKSTVHRNQLLKDENGIWDWKHVYDESSDYDYSADLFNGGSYKWVITFYELQEEDGEYILPTDGKYYDMILTTGTVLGSNYKRIQSKKTDKIFKDYYIQLGKYSGGSFYPSGKRVRIDSYDESFGYIYPITGDEGFSEDEVTASRATHYKVYELGNNSGSLATKNKVDYCCADDYFSSHGGIFTDLTETLGNSFITTTYTNYTGQTEDATNFHPFQTSATNAGISCKNGETRVAFVGNTSTIGGIPAPNPTTAHNYEDGYDIVKLHPFNGIWVPYLYGSTGNTVTVRWSRSPDADSIGEIMGKTVYVGGGDYSGRNITFDTMSPHTVPSREWNVVIINTTSGSIGLTITSGGDTEKAVSLYDTSPSTIGEIFYNIPENCEAHTLGKVYLRPFVGLESGMWWQEIDGTKRKDDLRHFIIKEVNTDYWYVTYSDPSTCGEIFDIDKTRYQIKSFFRDSDENPFSFQSAPTINITAYELGSSEPIEDGKVDQSRNIYCLADYLQPDNISWQSFQWFLYDEDGKLIDQSDICYDGIIEHTFYGLAGKDEDGNNRKFNIILIITTRDGQTYKASLGIETTFEELEIDDYHIGVSFDCDLTAVTLDMAPNGIIVQNDGANAKVEGKYLDLKDDIIYHKVYPIEPNRSSGDVDISYVELRDTDQTEILQVESQHVILSPEYQGRLLKLEDTDNKNPLFDVAIAKMVTKNESDDYVLNDDRNKIIYEYVDPNGNYASGGVKIIPDPGVGTGLDPTNGEWRDIPIDMVYVSNWQPKYLKNKTVLSDNNNPYSKKTNYLNLTFGEDEFGNEYRNINGEFNIYETDDSPENLQIIHEPLMTEESYSQSVGVPIVVDDNGDSVYIELSNGELYALPNGFRPMMFSDYNFVNVNTINQDTELLEGKLNSDGALIYRKKNICSKLNHWIWNDDTVSEIYSDNNGDLFAEDEDTLYVSGSPQELIWEDGDYYTYHEYDDTIQVGRVELNGSIADRDFEVKAPDKEVGQTEWMQQIKLRGIPERAPIRNKIITIKALLDSDFKPIPNSEDAVKPLTDKNGKILQDGNSNILVVEGDKFKQLIAFLSTNEQNRLLIERAYDIQRRSNRLSIK